MLGWHPRDKHFIVCGNLLNMEETYRFSVVVQKEGKWYVSLCPEFDIASQGETIEEAIENLKEAIETFSN